MINFSLRTVILATLLMFTPSPKEISREISREIVWDRVILSSTAEELHEYCLEAEKKLEASTMSLYGIPQGMPLERIPFGNPLEQPKKQNPVFEGLSFEDSVALCSAEPRMKKILDKKYNYMSRSAD